MSNPFLELFRGIAHGAIDAGATKAMMGAPPKRRRSVKKPGASASSEGCAPCGAMDKADRHRDAIKNYYRFPSG